MKPALLTTLPAIALACTLSACGGGGDGSPSTSTPATGSLTQSSLARNTSVNVPDADAAALRQGNTAFATDLYGTLQKDASFANKNLFFSPHSISVALAMTSAGARGVTASELKNTMHFTLPDARLHAAFDALDLKLSSRPPVADGQVPATLNIANSIWGEATLAFEQPFLDTLAVNYGAGVYRADFMHNPEPARTAINNWVADKTKDKILNVLPPGAITGYTRVVLVNAVYFNGGWHLPFSPGATAAGSFHGVTRDTTAQMMKITANFAYGAGNGWRAIQLPYDGGLTFTAILPDSLTAFESSFNATTLASIDSALKTTSVILTMPKFQIKDATFSVKNALRTLGTVTLFGREADLSGITSKDSLFVSDVLHKAFIDVDEKGTEAAAVTLVNINTSSPLPQPSPPPVVLTLDKPFVFLIRDTATGAILFLGRYVGG
jgi:serpin B